MLADGGQSTDAVPPGPDEDFLDMLMRCQGWRIEEQRSLLPPAGPLTVPEDDIYQLVQRMQAGRLEEQRAALAGDEQPPET